MILLCTIVVLIAIIGFVFIIYFYFFLVATNYSENASPQSYCNEMSRFHTQSIQNAQNWNPVIAAPTKTSIVTKNMTTITPSMPIASSLMSSSSSCWNWILFSPEYYSEYYSPSSFCTQHQQKIEGQKDDDSNLNLLASLPTWLLTLLYLEPKLIRASDENDSDQEISSIHVAKESLLSLSSVNYIAEHVTNNSSSASLSLDCNNGSNLEINNKKSEQNRSPTPDTDDGYQSASDASRSDYSQKSLIAENRHDSKDDITIIKHSSLTSFTPRCLTYAAAVKPITSLADKASLVTPIAKPKQTSNDTLLKTSITGTNEVLHIKGQRLKFIAPRFERMHYTKYPWSSTTIRKGVLSNSSNRIQVHSTTNNDRNHIFNSMRRR